MDYTIQNEHMQVTVETFGAQLKSVKKDGKEYLWQRDTSYWRDSSPNLFPYIARLYGGEYTFEEKTYAMKIHGFLKYRELTLADSADDSLTFELKADDETLQQYPWKFTLRVIYKLDGDKLSVTTSIVNEDDKIMCFGVGGHPGFNVPMEDGLAFEDYYLELSEADDPVHIGFTETCFRNGCDVPYELDEKKRIPLHHDLFDNDAIVLKNAGHMVKIGSDKGKKALIVRWDHEYVGFWHKPKTDAPYVCVEPWNSLPARDGIKEDFAKQPDLKSLEPGKTFNIGWSVEILTAC
ncbi:MAG: aldose 1-epimerase family protein [Blautia sp.]|nr:aldose 1-epimerase family protein [Blautia sp.]